MYGTSYCNIAKERHSEVSDLHHEYEDNDVNEAKLSVQELRELGIIKCGGCKSSGKCATCNCSTGCCKKSTKLEIKK